MNLIRRWNSTSLIYLAAALGQSTLSDRRYIYVDLGQSTISDRRYIYVDPSLENTYLNRLLGHETKFVGKPTMSDFRFGDIPENPKIPENPRFQELSTNFLGMGEKISTI